MPYHAGERPGPGRYCCTGCGTAIEITSDFEALPPCEVCERGPDAVYEPC
jgi:hypothetical protein